jgi:hypothetical protein
LSLMLCVSVANLSPRITSSSRSNRGSNCQKRVGSHPALCPSNGSNLASMTDISSLSRTKIGFPVGLRHVYCSKLKQSALLRRRTAMEIPRSSDDGNVPHTFSIPSCRQLASIRVGELSNRRRVTRRASQRVDSVLEAELQDRHSMSRIILGLGIAVFCR